MVQSCRRWFLFLCTAPPSLVCSIGHYRKRKEKSTLRGIWRRCKTKRLLYLNSLTSCTRFYQFLNCALSTILRFLDHRFLAFGLSALFWEKAYQAFLSTRGRKLAVTLVTKGKRTLEVWPARNHVGLAVPGLTRRGCLIITVKSPWLWKPWLSLLRVFSPYQFPILSLKWSNHILPGCFQAGQIKFSKNSVELPRDESFSLSPLTSPLFNLFCLARMDAPK